MTAFPTLRACQDGWAIQVASGKFFEILPLSCLEVPASDLSCSRVLYDLRNKDGSVAFRSDKEKAGYGLQAGVAACRGVPRQRSTLRGGLVALPRGAILRQLAGERLATFAGPSRTAVSAALLAARSQWGPHTARCLYDSDSFDSPVLGSSLITFRSLWFTAWAGAKRCVLRSLSLVASETWLRFSEFLDPWAVNVRAPRLPRQTVAASPSLCVAVDQTCRYSFFWLNS